MHYCGVIQDNLARSCGRAHHDECAYWLFSNYISRLFQYSVLFVHVILYHSLLFSGKIPTLQSCVTALPFLKSDSLDNTLFEVALIHTLFSLIALPVSFTCAFNLF